MKNGFRTSGFALEEARAMLYGSLHQFEKEVDPGNVKAADQNHRLLPAVYLLNRAMGFCEACGAVAPPQNNNISGGIQRIKSGSGDATDGPLNMVYLCRTCMEQAQNVNSREPFSKYLFQKVAWLERSIEEGLLKYVTAAIITSENKFLITKRADSGIAGGKWEFPGGKVQPGETLEKCLAREIREELNGELEKITPFRRVDQDYCSFQIRLYSFICNVKNTSELRLRVHADYAWVKLHELDDYDFSQADLQLICYLMSPP